ncbi:NAD(P)/FAD-dependent oxidoreductase [Lignipirellula cremea]|uniref:Oxidoreductase n=1 Tax=Lignipirellula cremea TaxID=2528010 RepID=A0A518DPP8_9BACT|nr:FAD-dependent monooxygenase [Lignipirellula cremea]QDU93817.1 Putative oxidoreductase [Lignipirellula cremea]
MNSLRIHPTITRAQAQNRIWDAIVVGAGPAGSLAARQIASAGSNVLLIDKAHFPRWKVCGCCLNGAALAVLSEVGLGELPAQLGALPLDHLRLCASTGQAVCRLPGGVSVSRVALDAALIRAAIESGVSFLDETTATILPQDPAGETAEWRQVRLEGNDFDTPLRTRVVLAADGLAGRSLHLEPGLESQVAEGSRVGAGVVLDDPGDYEQGVIYMACALPGYVGLVRLEDGTLDLAAAFDRKALQASGSPGALAAQILKVAGLPAPPALETAAWKGTTLLTRRRSKASGTRLFILGDAAGYVEPFTGEGIAWAMQSAATVAPIAFAGANQWTASLERQWESRRSQMLFVRERTCRYVGALLRRPRLAATAVSILRRAPWLAAPVIYAINAPPWKTSGARSSTGSNS